MFHPNCTVSLYRRLNTVDGKAVFGSPEKLPGCLIAYRQCTAGVGVEMQEKSLLYLQSDTIPAPGDEVLIENRRFTLGSVRSCRDLLGKLRGVRCTFL